MTTETGCRESFKAGAGSLMDRLRKLIHEGNVRRVVVESEGQSIAEFPVTAGVVGTILAPMVAAIGALVALLKDCTIHVERVSSAAVSDTASTSKVEHVA
jgi:hypothetical protein